GESRVLREAAGRGAVLLRVGLRLHARDAVADRPRDPGEGGGGPREGRPRLVAARRAGLRDRGRVIAAGSPRAALPAVLMLVLAPVALAAGAGTARAASAPRAWYEEVAVNGFLESSYSYNFDRPDTRRNALRVFDFDDNTFQLGVAELVVQRAVAKPREAGFRVDLEAGGSIPRVAAAAGLFRDPVTGAAKDVDLQQAF